MTSSGPDSPGVSTCLNCFAEFEWPPFVQDGDDFCCSGCADGGPCICTYSGAPHLAGQDTPTNGQPAPGEANADDTEPVEETPAASSGDGTPPEPPDEVPGPAYQPDEDDEDEPPTNGRLAIIMSAISEMPFPVQEVVRARLANAGSDDDIGQPLGLTGEEVRQLISQGQAILDRTIGSTFRIRYIGAEDIAVDRPEPEFPQFDDEDVDAEEPTLEPTDEERTQLRDLIAQSFSAIADASTGEGIETQASRDVLSETLREVGNLLKLAAERLVAEEQPDISMKDALADRRGTDEPVTLVIENQHDLTPFFIALQGHESVLWAKLRSHTPDRTEFRLMISSMMAFVRDMMTMEGGLRPTRLQMSGDQVTVELPQEQASEVGQGPATPVPAAANGSKPGPHFEMSVDSFFGARHFIESGSSAPHHHSYRVEVTFATSQPDRHGFVVGFANVRQMVDSTVMLYSETLLNTEDPFREIPPTTENLARVFHQKISAKLSDLGVPSVSLGRVRVWESPTNSASYSETGSSSGAGPEPHAAAAS